MEAHLGVAPAISIGELGDIWDSVGAAVQALHQIYIDFGIPADQLSRMTRCGMSWNGPEGMAACTGARPTA